MIPLKAGTRLVMVGRPRKSGRRERNGRIQRAYVSPKAQVAAQPHRRSVPIDHRERQEAESEFGRLLLLGQVTPAQYEAGKQYAELVAGFCRIYGVPSPTPRSCSLLGSYGPGGDIPVHVVAALKERYQRAFEACESAGRAAQLAVKECAVLDRRLTIEGYCLLRAGLERLVIFFGVHPEMKLR